MSQQSQSFFSIKYLFVPTERSDTNFISLPLACSLRRQELTMTSVAWIDRSGQFASRGGWIFRAGHDALCAKPSRSGHMSGTTHRTGWALVALGFPEHNGAHTLKSRLFCQNTPETFQRIFRVEDAQVYNGLGKLFQSRGDGMGCSGFIHR